MLRFNLGFDVLMRSPPPTDVGAIPTAEVAAAAGGEDDNDRGSKTSLPFRLDLVKDLEPADSSVVDFSLELWLLAEAKTLSILAAATVRVGRSTVTVSILHPLWQVRIRHSRA